MKPLNSSKERKKKKKKKTDLVSWIHVYKVALQVSKICHILAGPETSGYFEDLERKEFT